MSIASQASLVKIKGLIKEIKNASQRIIFLMDHAILSGVYTILFLN